MSGKPKIESFKGDNFEECTAFIQAIRQAAWAEGRLRDPAWMADFASLYFSSKATSWHAKLPLEVRQDWFKLEGALVDHWAVAEEDNDSHIYPAPAAAPMPVAGDNSDPVVRGILKVIPDDITSEPAYVKRGTATCSFSGDRETALRVIFNSRSKYGLIECSGDSIRSWLAIHWGKPKPDLRSGSQSWAAPTIVSSDNLKSPWEVDGPCQLMGCTVSSRGEITPVWMGANKSQGIPLYVFLSQQFLWLTVDPEAFSRKNPSKKRAKLVIEPID